LATGNLTIKKKRSKFPFPALFCKVQKKLFFSGTFNIKGLGDGIGSNSIMMSNQVDIRLNITVKI